ncbi:MAG: rRNA cytosine-C5-methyltransferase [Bacteroidales bacterium]|nr:rRNA cytosine-C5-methyltransferase [Bacteroidales bacterium]
MIPEGFREFIAQSLGEDAAGRLIEGLGQEPPVSVRANPAKISEAELREHFGDLAGDAVEWSEDAFYLRERPSFTLDPLFHAGAYYVQEASSMYVGHLLRGLIAGGPAGCRILDLCAAPGGKSTDTASLLGANDLLVSNEVIGSRASILAENMAKWGLPGTVVTNSDPVAFASLKDFFDIVLVDAPCSGEGMFRKDERAAAEWSPETVNLCAARQRRILADVWPALREGGHIIYSTCTFNRFEDEENAAWIATELGAELIGQRHFLPGRDRGEGFYCALLRKAGDKPHSHAPSLSAKRLPSPADDLLEEGFRPLVKGTLIKAIPDALSGAIQLLESKLRVIRSGVAVAQLKGRDLIPEADLALSTAYRRDSFPEVELDRATALKFLAREPFVLEGMPKGFFLLTYKNLPLGFVKNLGNRCNNLLPASRRIRMDISK